MAKLSDIVAGEPQFQGQPELPVDGTSKTKKQIEALELESKQLEVETKKLELLEKRANLQDLQERLDERELKRETKRQRSLTNGATIKSLLENDNAAQKRCNHRKGGNGAQGVVGGQGDDSQYAVMKHTFANGDMWVRCLRCGKTWKPPYRPNYISEETYLVDFNAYQAAVNFQTRNVPSGSVQFRFSDGGDYYRKVTANTNLR